MAEVTIDSSVIEKTQETLGKYIKKPALSEKLLRKPPFRFLHDVFNAVIRDTGCFEGLYTQEELSFENITDRDAKMQFLQKMIDTIKIATDEPLTVKTSKIVAGHEPEKTNQLLQLMGIVIDKKIDWKGAVEKVKINQEGPLNHKLKAKDQVSNEKKANDKPITKVQMNKNVESPKEKMKLEEKKMAKSKEVKEKRVNTVLKSSEVEKKEDRKTKTIPSSRDSMKSRESMRSKESMKSRESTKRSPPEKPKKSTKIEEPKPEAKSRSAEKKKQTEEPVPVKQPIEKEPIKNDVKKADKDKVTPEKESLATDFKRDERRASKRAEEILMAAASDDASLTESRRSASSRRSSGKSRKTSAEKSRVPRADEISGKMPTEINESLTTVAEEPPSNSQPAKTTVQNSDVKRETTFVRENSKEAVPNLSRPRTSLRPPSARPASARPGAPRRRDKNIEIILQPNDNVKPSGVNVKLETFSSELEDDGENLVIIENANTEDPLGETAFNQNKNDTDESMQQGHLVQQILETQKELVHGSIQNSEQIREKQENELAKLNSRQTSARHIGSLRDVIQNITKSVNPLGKLMDFIPEDIDAMQLELTMWRDTYNQSAVELKKERSLTETVTEPMKNQLVTIEATIKEYHDMIDECRAKILQNADKIQKLLTTQ